MLMFCFTVLFSSSISVYLDLIPDELHTKGMNVCVFVHAIGLGHFCRGKKKSIRR